MAAPKIEIVRDEAREQSSRGRKAWTLKVDGQPTLFWSPTEAAARRVASRLLAGRSGEAFGGAGLVQPGAVMATSPGHVPEARARLVRAGEATTETVTTKSGREKVRERQPGFVVELDGRPLNEGSPIAFEADARQLAAVAAFASRGRLGRFAEAERAFKDQTGKDAKVQVIDLPGSALHGRIAAKDSDGGLWEVGFAKSPLPGQARRIKFTQVAPPAPRGRK